MPSRIISWDVLAASISRADADMLESFKHFTVAKSDLGACCICSDASQHAMRTQLLQCACGACKSASPALPCPWRGRVRSCQILNVVSVDEVHAHVTTMRSATKPRLTEPMKEAIRDWAAHGLRPLRIWRSLIKRFNMFEATAPPLFVVQRFVHHYVGKQLGGSDVLAAVRKKITESAFTGEEDEMAPFTFTWKTDRDGNPVVGNGSDDRPFVVGVSTKKLLRQADCDPKSFILHLDATYKLTQVGYPVVDVGISDRSRQFHVLAIFIVSQQQQSQYSEILSTLCRISTAVTGKLVRVELAMGDANSAQWNALQEVFGGVESSFCFLMCFFHVAKQIYEKTRAFDLIVAAMVIRHVHELHFARNNAEFQLRYGEVIEEWNKWKQLDQFKVYFKKVWLNERVRRWQCYHTPSGFATTNNPYEAYNASLKRDVTLRRKLKVGALLDQLLTLCRAESVRSQPLQSFPAFDARLLRRAKALTRAGCLRETMLELNSIAFRLGDNDIEDTRQIVKVFATPATPQ